MYHQILAENHNSRREVPLWQLLCFSMFCIWQMGVIYYMGPALNIDGRTPLLISMDNVTLLIAAGYICSILVMAFIPIWVVRLSRAATVTALLSVLGLFFVSGEGNLTALIYIQAFCCCFMIGFETATMVYYFSEMSIVRYVLLAYPVAYTAVAVLQNDFFKIDFASFRILTVAMLVLLLLFFCKMPTKVCPRFVKKSDGLIMPKRFFTGVLLLVFLSALLGVIAPAVAAQYKHGVFVAYIGCVVCCLTVYVLHKITGKHPIQFMPYVVGIASLGYILLFVSHYASGLALIACALVGTGMTACALIPLFGVLMSKQYPSKFIAPGMIGLAMLAVITHSIIVELFRTSAIFLNITYLILVVVLAFLFVLTEPYLIYAMRRQFAPMADEQKEAPSLEEAQETPLPDVSAQVEAPTEAEQMQASPIALLTKREHEVLELINYGYSNADIAKMLFISEHTVKDHTKNIYRKMGVHSRFELAALVNRIKSSENNSNT